MRTNKDIDREINAARVGGPFSWGKPLTKSQNQYMDDLATRIKEARARKEQGLSYCVPRS